MEPDTNTVETIETWKQRHNRLARSLSGMSPSPVRDNMVLEFRALNVKITEAEVQ